MTQDAIYIETPTGLSEAAEGLAHVDRIAVDTESDSMHSYQEKVCFIQLAAAGRVFIVDTVVLRDLEPLRDIFANREITKIIHGADYDVVCLRRDFGLEIKGLFDTMIAAQYLGKERFGLASLCEEYFGVELDKSLTRHDWGRRPLEPKYHRYLADDVVYLAEIHDRLRVEIAHADVHSEAECEFRRIEKLEWSRAGFDPEGFWRLKQTRELDEPALRVLRRVFAARDELARRADVPPFKVASNAALVEIARRAPTTARELSRVWRAPRRLGRDGGDLMLAAIREGLEDERPVRRPRSGNRRSAEETRVEDELRRWRKEEAARRGCPTMVVLPNRLIAALSAGRPRTLDELAAIPDICPSRVERYGPTILRIIGETGGRPSTSRRQRSS